jgi:UDPglucose--hexose-1-phosphate uridylyltransferase
MSKPEIRKDYFKDEYVIFSPNRAKFLEKFKNLSPIQDRACPFCPESMKSEVITYKDDNYSGDWEIVSVINKFSALTLDNDMAFGQTEVIIETRKHGMDINDFSIDHIVRVFNAYIDRFMALRNIDGIKHVIIFKNEGGKAGASVIHTHSQVIALPILPKKIESEAQAYNKYRLEKVTCPYCDIINKEEDKPRVIWQDENVMALSPYASDSPYGVWLLPRRHMALFADLTRPEKESMAFALKLVLGKLDEFGINYNYFVENSVNNEDYHSHIKIAPRPNVWAGLELGTGIMINPITPEFAAKFYRGEFKTENNSKP